MTKAVNPISRALAIGRAINGLRGWGWALGLAVGGGGVTTLIAAMRGQWNALPGVAQASAVLAVFMVALLGVGWVLEWWRGRQGRLEDLLEVRIIQNAAMLREARVHGNAEFWKIYVLVEITYRPTDPTRVAALDFVLTVSLFNPVYGNGSFEISETHMGGLFKEDLPPLFHYLRAPLRFQGPHTERGGLLFLLDPATIEMAGGRENIDHNNSTLQITDHISRRSMSVVASQLDWSTQAGRPRRGAQGSPPASGAGELERQLHESVRAGVEAVRSTVGPGAINLRTLNNEQLRAHLREFAQQMRVFEAGFYHHEAVLERQEDMVAQQVTPEERTERRNQFRAMYQERHQRMSIEYRTRFHGHALALVTEAQARLGMVGNSESPWLQAILSSVLAGPTPITEHAAYLEHLANQLP